MPDGSTLALFAVASVAMLAFPGPSVLYIVSRSIDQGRRAGLVSMLGVEAGALVHVLAAAVGVSAILASSATAFSVVKYAGAAYLVYLGIQRLRRPGGFGLAGAPTAVPGRRLFRDGMIVNVLNPKTAVFFLAFLPQFVDPDRGAGAVQVFVLGAMFVVLAVLSDGLYAVVAGAVGARLRHSERLRRRIDRAGGGLLVGLGVAAAVSRR